MKSVGKHCRQTHRLEIRQNAAIVYPLMVPVQLHQNCCYFAAVTNTTHSKLCNMGSSSHTQLPHTVPVAQRSYRYHR